MEYNLKREGRPVTVSFKDGEVAVGKDRFAPTSVSWDSERRFPFILVLVVGMLIVISGVLAGAALTSEGLLWAAIIIVLPVTVIALLVMTRSMGGSVDQIVIQGGGKECTLSGDLGDLRSLHYEISKLTIAMMKSEERDRVEGRAGSYDGASVLGDEENASLKKDMKQMVGPKKKVSTTICPQCGSTELYYEAGLITGYVYHCKRCDYVGSFVIEKELKV